MRRAFRFIPIPELERAPDRILAGPEFSREILGHDRDRRAVGALDFEPIELASLEQRHAQGAKVIQPDDVIEDPQFLAFLERGGGTGGRRRAAKLDAAHPVVLAKGDVHGWAHRFHPGQRSEPFCSRPQQLSRLGFGGAEQTRLQSHVEVRAKLKPRVRVHGLHRAPGE